MLCINPFKIQFEFLSTTKLIKEKCAETFLYSLGVSAICESFSDWKQKIHITLVIKHTLLRLHIWTVIILCSISCCSFCLSSFACNFFVGVCSLGAPIIRIDGQFKCIRICGGHKQRKWIVYTSRNSCLYTIAKSFSSHKSVVSELNESIEKFNSVAKS